MTFKSFLITSVLFLSACDVSQKQHTDNSSDGLGLEKSEPSRFSDNIKSVSATSELRPPEPIIDATIIPKPGFAAWTGHLLLLTTSGKIYATNTGFGEMKNISNGSYTDIIGIPNGELPGIILAIDEAQQLEGFIENETGGFNNLNFDKFTGELAGFCDQESLDSSHFYGIVNGAIQKIAVDLKENELSLTDSGELFEKNIQSCHLNNDNSWSLIRNNEDIFAKTSIVSPQHGAIDIKVSDQGLFAGIENVDYKVEIKSGLSIMGIEKPIWVYSTSENLGNTFSQGLTMVIGSGSDRIVLISNDYLASQLIGDTQRNQ